MIIKNLPGKESITQYTNIEFFSRGGMGEIYTALNSANQNKKVAIKVIDASDPDYKDLLMREIDISMNISGANIVETLFTGNFSQGQNYYLYIVQNFYANGNLRSLIKENMPLEECIRLIKNILNGLKTLHCTIIHRDIKPDNILIDLDGIPAITDFGLAKFIDQKTRTKTFKGGGTLPYMAPECWLSQENSISMDIYAMGILFYELINGKLPFSYRTEQEWSDFHVYGQLPDTFNNRVDIPVKVKQIIFKMTQKRVHDRYKTADEVINALCEASTAVIQEKNEIERLASLGHGSFERIQTERLRLQKENDLIKEKKKHLNYHISELFNQIKTLVSAVNSRMEIGKVSINEAKPSDNPESKKLTIEFNSKKVFLTFPTHDFLEEQEKRRIENIQLQQRARHGYIFSIGNETLLKQKNIIYIGKVEANFTNLFFNEKFGYNIALVKQPTDIYGKWYVASFSDSGFSRSNRKNFAIELEEFAAEFPKAFITHTLTVDYHELTPTDLSNIIEELLR